MKPTLFFVLTIFIQPLTLLANFPPIVSASGSPDEAILGETVQFSSAGTFDPDGNPLTYLWDFGDGQSSTLANPAHDYTSAGHYTVSLKVNDGTVNRFAGLIITVLDPVALAAPTRSHTMALKASDELWVVNPDANSVSVLDVSTDTPALLMEIPVGAKPRTVALSIDGSLAYVPCENENALYVIDTATRTIIQAYATGHQPYGVAVARNDGRIVVTNQGDGSLTVYSADFTSSTMIFTGETPRAIAISGEGAYAYVTDYLTNGDTGTVWKIDLGAGVVEKVIPLVADPGPDTTSSGIGFPNVLSAIEIEPSGNYLWVGGLKSNTGRGLLVSGEPLVPTNRTRGVLLEIDLTLDEEILEHRIDTNDADMAAGIAFSHHGRYLLTVHQGAETMSIYDVPFARTITDKSDGETVSFDRSDVGFAPQGVLVSVDGNRAYVNNFLSRTVSVHDITNVQSVYQIDEVTTTGVETLTASILNGKRLFYRSKEPQMSESNYISCVSCHPDGGMADGRTWDFTQIGEGLRNTIDLRGKGGMDHGPVHWSGNFDEIQDFENDIVNSFGGAGLAQDGLGPHHSLSGPANGGRNQNLDDLAAYVASLQTPPPSPYRDTNNLLSPTALAGRQLFFSAQLQCATCHTTPRYTDSTLTPNPADYIFHNVGTLLPSSGQRLGATLAGLDTPSLQGVWATPPYLHDGRAATLQEVLTTYNIDDQHGVTSQLDSTQLDALVEFLQSIDGSPNDQWPVVDAGLDIAANAGWLVDLEGMVADDGLPANHGTTILRWETDAPSAVFQHNDALGTGVVFPAPGDYSLTLLASDDGGATWPSAHTVSVSISGGNEPPIQTYAAFKQVNFTPSEQLDDLISGPNANPDGDNKINLFEYYQSSDPITPDGRNRLMMNIGNAPEGIWVRHQIRSKAVDVSTSWLRSIDLVNWTPVTPSISGFIENANDTFTLEARFDDQLIYPAFYILEITTGD